MTLWKKRKKMEKNIFFHHRNPQENILEKYPSPKGEGNNIFPNEYLSRGFQPGKIKKYYFRPRIKTAA